MHASSYVHCYHDVAQGVANVVQLSRNVEEFDGVRIGLSMLCPGLLP